MFHRGLHPLASPLHLDSSFSTTLPWAWLCSHSVRAGFRIVDLEGDSLHEVEKMARSMRALHLKNSLSFTLSV